MQGSLWTRFQRDKRLMDEQLAPAAGQVWAGGRAEEGPCLALRGDSSGIRRKSQAFSYSTGWQPRLESERTPDKKGANHAALQLPPQPQNRAEKAQRRSSRKQTARGLSIVRTVVDARALLELKSEVSPNADTEPPSPPSPNADELKDQPLTVATRQEKAGSLPERENKTFNSSSYFKRNNLWKTPVLTILANFSCNIP